MKTLFKTLLILNLSFFILACENKPRRQAVAVNYSKLKEDIIKANKPAVVMENDEINAYIKSHHYTMQETGTGLRYTFLKQNPGGKKIEKGNKVKVAYKVSLLNGTACYSSDNRGPKEFIVGADNVESGVHEGIQLMRTGEKAIFILPAHLAFGLLGDRDKIPPKAAVVYQIEVLSVK